MLNIKHSEINTTTQEDMATTVRLCLKKANNTATNRPVAAAYTLPVAYSAAGKVMAESTVYGI